MRDLLKLYRFALRTRNRPLAATLTAILRQDPRLREAADRELQELPRGPMHWSAAAERAVWRVMDRIGALLP